MIAQLKKSLQEAEGRSEFVIAVLCDIRGFSEFSTIHESPDIAMFIKRFYLKLLDEYFPTAVFAKTTGDGLLMVFRYSENSLCDVAKLILNTCFRVLNDFPNMFKLDPMINFATPVNLGFGIVRGTACCLFSKKRILDYSGQLLNLVARLNEMARPKGIVIDGAFQVKVIPEALRASFVQCHAYIRSIAEETSKEILCSKDVALPAYSQAPLATYEWIIDRKEFSVEEFSQLDGNYVLHLRREPLTLEKTKLQIIFPNQKIKGYRIQYDLHSYELFKDAKGHHIKFQVSQAQSIIQSESLSKETKVAFEFQYVPKPKKKKTKRTSQ